MKKLLTDKEVFSNCRNVYNEDYTAFKVEGEPRGKMKQDSIEWHSEEDYLSLQKLFNLLGLCDYIAIALDKDMLYMRIMEEDE